jgi:hypothetical protein
MNDFQKEDGIEAVPAKNLDDGLVEIKTPNKL